MTAIRQAINFIESFLCMEGIQLECTRGATASGMFQVRGDWYCPKISVQVNVKASEPEAQELAILAHETGHYLNYKADTPWWDILSKALSVSEKAYFDKVKEKMLLEEETKAWDQGFGLIQRSEVELTSTFYQYFKGYRDYCLETYMPKEILDKRHLGSSFATAKETLSHWATIQPVRSKDYL